jgi:glycosyltransferase involved in cell wall biosynthesis
MGLIGAGMARLLGIPHLYDMHSSLPQQLSNFKYSRSGSLRRLFEWAERRMVHGSRVVITICQELQETVEQMGVGERALLIENVMGGDVDEAPSRPAAEIRTAWGIPAEAPLALYTGTFEPYQGVELLIESAAILARTRPHVRLLVVGGEPQQVDKARGLARERGAADVMVFTGQQPARDIPSFVQACDVLVSPRIRGTNTPLKIYSYLRSGRPILATDLLTHTQVLTSDIAVLVAPEPEAFADALAALLDDPGARAALAARAREVADEKYSRESYVRRTAQAYARLSPGATGPASTSIPVAGR